MALSQRTSRAAASLTKSLAAPSIRPIQGPDSFRCSIASRSTSRAYRTVTHGSDTFSAADASLNESIASELTKFRKLFESIPFVFQGPKAEPHEFQFATGTLFNAPTPEIGLKMAPAYIRALKDHGIAAIDLGFHDPDSQFLLNVVEAIGCKADSHSSTQGALWDVRNNPEGVKSEGTGKAAHSISHSLDEFDWHTDAAFEKDPMRFFGFHIIHPDKQGGGIFRLLHVDELSSLLSTETVNTLLAKDFDLKVPPEFFKGESTIKGKLLHYDEASKQTFIRFRRDILQNPPSDDPAACKAVAELLNLLDDPERVGKSMPASVFKENAVLLMDNAQFLHSRTKIKDPKRWLRRIRFRGELKAAQDFRN
ncbi:hypothetical protein DV735_g5515, partial [Chaetothyriales sp. CBS 134920]